MRKEKPGKTISIIIPVYNVEEYLLPCLESVEKSIRNIDAEVLLIDDGSTDRSSDLAKAFASEHAEFEYYRKENGGLSDARNYGAARAAGKYICFVDSDDIVKENMYENMLAAAEYHEADLTIVNVARFNSLKTWESSLHQRVFNGIRTAAVHISNCDNLIYDTTAWNKLIRRSFWEENGFKYPVGWRFEDMPVSLRMHCKANRVALVREVGYMWRIRDGRTVSITQENSSLINLKHRLRMLEDMFEYIDEEQGGDSRLKALLIYKLLCVDLVLYVDLIPSIQDRAVRDEYAGTIRSFYYRYIHASDLEKVPALIRRKYECALGGNAALLEELVKYGKREYYNCPVTYRDGSYIMDLPGDLFPKTNESLENDLRIVRPKYNITDYRLNERGIEIFSYLYYRRVDTSFFGEPEPKATLINSITGASAELKITKKDNRLPELLDGKIYGEAAGNSRSYNYDGAGVAVSVDFKEMNIDEKFKGDNFIVFENLAPVNKNSRLLKFSDEYPEYTRDIRKRLANTVIYDDHVRALIRSDAAGNIIIRIEDASVTGEQHIDRTEVTINEDGTAIAACSDGKVRTVNDSEWYAVKNTEIRGSEAMIHIIFSGADVAAHSDMKLAYYDHLDEKTVELSSDYTYEDGELLFRIDFGAEELDRNLYAGDRKIILIKGPDRDEYPLLAAPCSMKTLYSETKTICIYPDKNAELSFHSKTTRPLTKNEIIHTRKHLYPEYMKEALDENCIVFEAYWGEQYSCNPRALYEYIDANHPEYKCVWSFKDEYMPIRGNGIRVRKYSPEYYHYLATAKYLVNNVNFENEYKKKEGQIEIQTMHGTPYKSMGLDVDDDFTNERAKYKYIVRNRRWNYMVVQGHFSEEMAWRWFRYKGNILRTGYPRTDQLFSITDEEKKEIRKKCGIPEGKKVILYAPTFRKMGQYEMPLDLDIMREKLSGEYVFLIRLHHFATSYYSVPEDREFIFDAGKYSRIDDLYKITDVLVTDYSSVMFDFALTGRPIVFYTYDLEEYTNEIRGSYFSIEEEAPGPLVRTTEELVKAILEPDNGYSKRREAFFERYLTYEQGDSSERIFEEVFIKGPGIKDLSPRTALINGLKLILPKQYFYKLRKAIIRRDF